MKFTTSVLAVAAVGVATVSGQNTIVDVAVSQSPEFTTLVTLVSAVPSLATALSSPGTFTVFAPTNQAFTNLFATDADLAENLQKSYNEDLLASVLGYHALGATVLSTDLAPTQTVATVEGSDIVINAVDLTIKTTSGGVANILNVDIEASNGVIHVVDAVLVPANVLPAFKFIANIPPAATTGLLAEALIAADLLGVFNAPSDTGFTVFAPTDAAFVALLGDLGLTKEELFASKELLTTVLKYHVVSGVCDAACVSAETSLTTITDDAQTIAVGTTGGVFLNTAQVTTPNVRAYNGIVHVIDAVLLPKELQPSEPTMAPKTPTVSSASSTYAAFSMMSLVVANVAIRA